MSGAWHTPDIVLIGHATRDLTPDGWLLGGTVTYAGIAAERLGMRVGILTSGPADVIAALREALPAAAIVARPAPSALTFENIYEGPIRRQFLRGQAADLTPADLPEAWRAAPVALLAPLAQEVEPSLAATFPHALVAATPQGWLRRWDERGVVRPCVFTVADHIFPHLRALILSREDVMAREGVEVEDGVPRTPAEADACIAGWARVVPLVAVTRGSEGALLYVDGAAPETFPGYAAQEVDPTGAGDVFAAAFLCHLHASGNPREAADFANRVAACSVEKIGFASIPTRAEVVDRFGV